LIEWRTLLRVKAMLGFILVLLIIGVVLRMAGTQIPIIDYPLGRGPLTQPQIEIVQPDLNLP
jgi:Na+/citrate or Na+/malate symporter